MSEIPLELMKLQGKIRLYLIQCGIDEEAALTVSGKVLDRVMGSPMVKDEYKQAYQATQAQEDK